MNLRLLPSYTTERYYILSEIEDRANFEVVEMKEGSCIIEQNVMNYRHHTATFEEPFHI